MPDPSPPGHFVVLANPAAGGGAAPRCAADVAHLLRAAGARVELHVTADLDDARVRARTAAAGGAVVVVAGGDGTVGAVAGVLVEAGGVLGIVPAGRGNDFAGALGLPEDPEALARVLLAGRERAVDVLDVAGRTVVGSVATGIDAAADARVHARSRLPPRVAYPVAALRSLLGFRFPDYAVALDGAPGFEASAYTVVVANAGRYGAGLHVAPGAQVADGQLDVVVIGAFARRRFPRLLRAMRAGDHVVWPEVTVRRGRSVTVAADRPLSARGDGEALGALPVTVTVRPGALRVRSPSTRGNARVAGTGTLL